jgi:hypothetical protein
MYVTNSDCSIQCSKLTKYELYMALTLCHMVLQFTTSCVEHNTGVFFNMLHTV